MKTPKCLSTIAAGLVLCLASITAPAADGPPENPTTALDSRITFDFADVLLVEAGNFLASKNPNLNIIIDPSLKTERISVKGTHLKLGDVFAVIDQMIGCRSMVHMQKLGWVKISEARMANFKDHGEPVVVYIEAGVPDPLSTEAGAPDRTESTLVYFVGSLLSDKMTIEDVAAAIEMTWSMQFDGSEPRLKFHDETRMLIVKATPELLEVADQVIAQLPGGAEVLQRALAARVSRSPDPRMMALSQLSEVKIDRLEEQFERKISELEVNLAREQHRSFELNGARVESEATYRAKAEKSKKEADEMRMRVAELESELKALKETRK